MFLAFAIPFGKGDSGPSHKLQSFLHLPVAFLILPLFALANTCISITGIAFSDLYVAGVYGTVVGLVFGKPVGIFLFTLFANKVFKLNLPTGVNFKHIVGAGIVAGIGFTMSIFITDLAFTQDFYIKQIKLAILLSALVSSLLGIFYFKLFIPKVK